MHRSLVILAILALSASAHADGTVQAKDEARRLFKEGNELHEQQEVRAALGKYRQAYALARTPILGLVVCRTHAELGELVAAKRACDEVASIERKKDESKETAVARHEAVQLARSLEERVPHLMVHVTGVPAGATLELTVDGAPVPQAGALALDPGKHRVAAHAGTVERRAEVTLAEGQSKELVLDLPPEPPKPPPTVIERGQSTWFYVGVATAGVGVIVGGVTGALAFHRTSAAEEGCVDGRCRPEVHDDVNAAKTYGNVSTIAFIAGGAGAAIAGAALLFGGSDEKHTTGVRPWIGISSAGLSARF